LRQSRSAPPVWSDHLLFLGRFLRHPRTVGAVAPSSRRLARALVAPMRQVPGTRIAELGPGTGIVTREIAASLSPVARALAIDLDPVFVARESKSG